MSVAKEMAEKTKTAMEFMEEARKVREADDREASMKRAAAEREQNERLCPIIVANLLKEIEAAALKGKSSIETTALRYQWELQRLVEKALQAKGFQTKQETDVNYECADESFVMTRSETPTLRVSW